MLVMQAVKYGAPSVYYGYKALGSYGAINPDYIYHQGKKYEINSFYTSTLAGASYLYFKDNKVPNGEKMIIEVNGTVYTLVKQTDYNRYYIKAWLFTAGSTYIIKILSIE